MTKKLPVLKQFSRDFQVPMSAVYVAIVAVVSVAGLFAMTSAVKEQQSIDSSAQAIPVVSCNEPCTNNRQCPPDHFCYQGRCRLADNPESPTCERAPVASPTPVATATPEPISDETKGMESTLPPTTDELLEPTPDLEQPTATEAGLLQPTLEPDTETETATPPAWFEPEPTTVVPQTLPIIDESITAEAEPDSLVAGIFQMIDRLLAQITNSTEEGLSLPLLLGIGLIGLILLVVIVTLVNSKKSKVKYQPSDFSQLEQKPEETIPSQPTQSSQAADQSAPQTNQSTQQVTPPPLQPAQPVPQPSPQSTQTPSQSTQTPPQSTQTPQQSTEQSTQPLPQNTATNDDELEPPPSAMISRFKEKGVDVPQDN